MMKVFDTYQKLRLLESVKENSFICVMVSPRLEYTKQTGGENMILNDPGD